MSSNGSPPKALQEVLAEIPEDYVREVKRVDSMFAVTKDKLKQITHHFVGELEKGLSVEGGNIPMNVTWVMGFPTGNENGKFLALDMGGTNLRVCEVVLTGGRGKYDIVQDKYKMPEDLKTGSAEHLWGFTADCIGAFLEERHLLQSPEKIPMAFTFSYPVTQRTIKNGILQRWTKDFNIDGVKGQDVVPQLEAALAQRNIPVKIVALVNDTTGTLIASSYHDPEIQIGSIFSTGCNAAYMETCGAIPKIKDYNFPPDTPVAINTEYGAFDNERKVLPITPFDREIDKASPRPGQQTYEKMVAGLYLGELLRLILLELHNTSGLFKGQDISRLHQSHVVDSSFLSTIEKDVSESMGDIFNLFDKQLGLKPAAYELKVCRYMVELIATRAARLYACGIAAICKKKGITSCHVGVDGTVFKYYSNFRIRASQALREILDWPPDSEDLVTLHSAEDGSGVGAALIAALALERSDGSLLS